MAWEAGGWRAGSDVETVEKYGRQIPAPSQRSAWLTALLIQELLKSCLLRQTFPDTHLGWGGKAGQQ